MTKISTGAPFLDQFLEGGYDHDIVTTIYGPSGSGKTNLCLIAAVHQAQQGKKIIFFNPLTFEEQKAIFETLRQMVNEHIGMIIVDSVSMLYRLELGKNEEVYEVNSALGRQIAYLVEIARRKKIPVLLTTQVYADFDHRDQVKIVGGDLLKYGSKCLLELVKLNNSRGIILRKHRSLPEGKELQFRIVQEGIEEV